METIKIKYHMTPFGELILGSYNNKFCLADWRYRKMRGAIDLRIQKGLEAKFEEGDSEVLLLAEQQLDEYFKGERQNFDISLLMVGTDFQKTVWEALVEINYGETSSYLALSRQLGNEKAIRAVATANGTNAISIIIPCHRIIGSDGKLVGYAGGLKAKKKLLELENPLFDRQLALF